MSDTEDLEPSEGRDVSFSLFMSFLAMGEEEGEVKTAPDGSGGRKICLEDDLSIDSRQACILACGYSRTTDDNKPDLYDMFLHFAQTFHMRTSGDNRPAFDYYAPPTSAAMIERREAIDTEDLMSSVGENIADVTFVDFESARIPSAGAEEPYKLKSFLAALLVQALGREITDADGKRFACPKCTTLKDKYETPPIFADCKFIQLPSEPYGHEICGNCMARDIGAGACVIDMP